MGDLSGFRVKVLNADSPAAMLNMADMYIKQANELGDMFILPKEHRVVDAPVATFKDNLHGWHDFVREIYEHLDWRSEKRLDVHKVYRVVNTRLIQQQRRKRLNAAVDKAVQLGLIHDDYQVKLAYARKCTQVWQKGSIALLKASRKTTDNKRVSQKDREQLLAEYWADIDADIAKGRLPNP